MSIAGQNGRNVADNIAKCIVFDESFQFWFKFHWFIPKGSIDNKSALVAKPLPEPMLIQFITTSTHH